ncbi:MAG: [citrate (pro-3S)-lyase] ligase [Geobacteraceae bacterium]
MVTELACVPDIGGARAFIEQNGLTFEEGYDDLVGVHEGDELVAVGARAGNILKMLVVEPSRQNGAFLGEVVTDLVGRGFAAGFASLFVFTKPEYATTFEALNFSLLASHERVALLEYGGGLERWLSSNLSLVRKGVNGAVVVNCNPFTLGHRHLVETASRQVDNLYIFVVREERSEFPFAVRFRLVEEGVRDIPNVLLLDTSSYAVSSITFPAYFMKRDDPIALIQMELDLTLFAARIATFFKISRRFIGTEPCCTTTSSYNEAMKRLLPVYGLDVVEVPRKETADGVISASRVRELLKCDDLAAIEMLVPGTTLAYLRSAEAAPVREKLRKSNGRDLNEDSEKSAGRHYAVK